MNNQQNPMSSTNGTYVGNDTVNRAIPHGLGKIPSFVFVVDQSNSGVFSIHQKAGGFIFLLSGGGKLAVTAMDATYFYVGNATSYPNSGNSNGVTWAWSACP